MLSCTWFTQYCAAEGHQQTTSATRMVSEERQTSMKTEARKSMGESRVPGSTGHLFLCV